MAIEFETRDLLRYRKDNARRFSGAMRAALIIGSIIGLFVLLSLVRPMPEEHPMPEKNVVGENSMQTSEPQR